MNAVACLYRYPVKGLSPEPLPAVELNVGDGFPLDRRMAITNGAWLFDAQTYEPRPKSSFLMLARDEALAALKTSVNPAGTELTLSAPDGRRIVADIDDDASLDALSDFLHAYLGGRLQGPPRLVRSASHRFTDVSVVSPAMMSSVSLINLASLRELEQAMGRALDPLRFRAYATSRCRRPWPTVLATATWGFMRRSCGVAFCVHTTKFRCCTNPSRVLPDSRRAWGYNPRNFGRARVGL